MGLTGTGDGWLERRFSTESLSLSSLLTNESRLSESRSLSWELAEVLLSESPGFSQGGGVGKEGGVRCKRFHGSWWPLLLLLLKCCCALGPSLWPNTELAAVRDFSAGFPSPPKADELRDPSPPNDGGLLKGSKWDAGVRKFPGWWGG